MSWIKCFGCWSSPKDESPYQKPSRMKSNAKSISFGPSGSFAQVVKCAEPSLSKENFSKERICSSTVKDADKLHNGTEVNLGPTQSTQPIFRKDGLETGVIEHTPMMGAAFTIRKCEGAGGNEMSNSIKIQGVGEIKKVTRVWTSDLYSTNYL